MFKEAEENSTMRREIENIKKTQLELLEMEETNGRGRQHAG